MPFNVLLPEFAKEGMTFLTQTYYDAFNAVETIIIRCIVHWPMPGRSMTIPALLRMRRETFGVRGEGEGGEFATPAPGTEVNAQVYALSCVTRGASESSATCPDRDSGLTHTASRLLADNPTETPVSQGNY